MIKFGKKENRNFYLLANISSIVLSIIDIIGFVMLKGNVQYSMCLLLITSLIGMILLVISDPKELFIMECILFGVFKEAALIWIIILVSDRSIRKLMNSIKTKMKIKNKHHIKKVKKK